MRKRIKQVNNRIVPGKEYQDITLAAEKVIKSSIENMVKKLCRLKNVEYFYDEDEQKADSCGFNNDTAFREAFHEIIENEVSYNLRAYSR